MDFALQLLSNAPINAKSDLSPGIDQTLIRFCSTVSTTNYRTWLDKNTPPPCFAVGRKHSALYFSSCFFQVFVMSLESKMVSSHQIIFIPVTQLHLFLVHISA